LNEANSRMSIIHKEKELSLYILFSVFLQREILNFDELDISCVPNEYIQYMSDLYEYTEESGDLILITMLFTEYYQKQQTGHFKITLTDNKYRQIGLQFSLFCKLELIRRTGKIKELKVRELFNPNVKTEFIISPPPPKALNIHAKLLKLGARII
tara:strand:- start:285 stop:749 length:465 start_codon:yes stop_codon:yes gene_type:complete